MIILIVMTLLCLKELALKAVNENQTKKYKEARETRAFLLQQI
jgi:hypothetical protein